MIKAFVRTKNGKFPDVNYYLAAEGFETLGYGVTLFENEAITQSFKDSPVFAGHRSAYGTSLEFVDLSQVSSAGGRYKEYARLKEDCNKVEMPTWNTSTYQEFDIDEEQPVPEKTTYPEIYGFKTPDKHTISEEDPPKYTKRWKRLEIMSSNCSFIMKDDNLPCGQWAKKEHKLVEQLMDQLKKAKESKPNPNKDQPEMLQNMGLGELASVVFVRTFRWTLNAINHPKVSMWIQKINVNYKDKTLEIEAFEDAHGCVAEWITEMAADSTARNFAINHYDGCGKVIFTNNYSGIEIKDHKIAYDYSNSDVLTHKLKLSYRTLRRSSNFTVN